MSVSIRMAKADELYLTRKIAYETWPVAYGAIISTEQLNYMLNMFYSDRSLMQQYDQLQHKFLLAFDAANNLTGFASYSSAQNEDISWKLHKLYVIPMFQRTGTGKALLHFIFNEMKDANVKSLLLNVNRNNKAVEFYKNIGFNIIKTEDIDIGGGYFMNDYVMSIEITRQADAFV